MVDSLKKTEENFWKNDLGIGSEHLSSYAQFIRYAFLILRPSKITVNSKFLTKKISFRELTVDDCVESGV